MATDVILGKAMTLTYDSKVIARCTDFTLEVNKEPIDITTVQSAGWTEKKVDLKEWSISFNALVTRGGHEQDALAVDVVGDDVERLADGEAPAARNGR